ncbi:MAG TPA: alcohol dehydrogenase [Candidatus Nitrosocosmicus sp.]|nr:alcohol dehydrogenase [Candidatus Nitrosocosmicus sp.]
MRSIQVSKPKGPLELVEKEVPEPGPRQVRIKVQACGICHSDTITKEGIFPGIQYPRVPGHEVAGLVDKIGKDVRNFQLGQRVAVGWHGGHCGQCESCRRGDFVTCTYAQIPGISYDGGYADYMVAPVEALALIPDQLSAIEAAPLMCAGITTFNALRNSGARAGDTVAIFGMGGLGHLGVQFAAKMGFNTVAIGRAGEEEEKLMKNLGAKHYIDNRSQNVVDELTKLGGAKIILATVPSGKAITDIIGGLATNGKLLAVGVSEDPIQVSTSLMILGRRSLIGWPSGTSIDSQDTLSFSVLSDVRSMNETFPLERAAEAYDHMMSGKAKFRCILTTGN